MQTLTNVHKKGEHRLASTSRRHCNSLLNMIIDGGIKSKRKRQSPLLLLVDYRIFLILFHFTAIIVVSMDIRAVMVHTSRYVAVISRRGLGFRFF